MRWVAHAADRPHRCAVIPFLGNSNGAEGFIDTGQTLPGWDPHVYVSVTAVKEMSRMIGWQPAQVQATHDLRVAERDARIAELEQQIADNARVVDAAKLLAEVTA